MAIRSLPISLALSLNSLDPDHQCADTRGINPAAQTKDEPGATGPMARQLKLRSDAEAEWEKEEW